MSKMLFEHFASLRGRNQTNITTISNMSLKAATDEFQKQQILQMLQNTAGNWSQAAKLLDLDRANLSRLAKRLGISIEKTVRS